MHKSQGMGRYYDEGPELNYYKLQQSTVKTKAKEADLFESIAYSFDDLAKDTAGKRDGAKIAKDLRTLQKDADEVIAAYPRFAAVAKEVHEMKLDVQAAVKDVKARNWTKRPRWISCTVCR